MYNSPLERDIYTQTKHKSDIYFDEVSDWVPYSETGFQFERDSSYSTIGRMSTPARA
jgi:hypothetical protein